MKLIRCCQDFIKLISEMMESKDWVFENIQERAIDALQIMETKCAEQGYFTQSITLAKYAFIAFFDELMLTLTWDGQQLWANNSLQQLFFAEHMAGENFFIKLADLKKNPKQNLAVLEVFYLCLQLGFTGKYRLTDSQGLIVEKNDLKECVDHEYQHDATLFVDDKSPMNKKQNPIFSTRTIWLVGGAVILLTQLLFAFLVHEQNASYQQKMNDNLLALSKADGGM